MLIALAMAVPAGASTVPAGNLALISAGSNTTYTMMQQLSDLYNSAPGCNLLTANSAAQELNYDCASSYSTSAPGDENGYSLTYSPVNPYNDVVWDEPALGSSNGIKELELEGADTPTSAPDNLISTTDFARSSRAAVTTGSTPDKAGLNFVAYAQDAVPWLYFSKTVGAGACATTPAASIPAAGLTTAQLSGIYEGTITNWHTVGGASAPIDVFIAQSGSGTEGTWATDLGLTGTYPYGGVSATASRLSLPASDFEIFENEVSDIWKVNDANASDKIACDSIFFFSFGKFSLLCPSGACAGTPHSNVGSVAKLGEIGGVKAKKSTIENGSFATDRQLYNVYSDGSNGNLPFAGSPQPKEGQAVMNFASTYGFLCSPTTHNDVIKANGFFPFNLGVEGDSGIATPPDFSDAGYAAASPAPSGDKGYCRVTTTDGDGNN
jgi:ABC-type phosphate transport system substrate-binding protein